MKTPDDHKPIEVTISVKKSTPNTTVSEGNAYCNECEFWEDKYPKGRAGGYSPTTDSCMHVLNGTGRLSHLAIMYKLINHPKDINKDNDCGRFVKKRGFIARLFGGRHKDRIGSGKKVCLPEWGDPPPRKP